MTCRDNDTVIPCGIQNIDIPVKLVQVLWTVVEGHASRRDLSFNPDTAFTHLLVHRSDGKDGGLGRVNDGRKLLDTIHPQVGDGEGAADELSRLQLAILGLRSMR